MRPSSILVLAVFLVLGVLVVEVALRGVPFKGPEADRGHGMLKGQGPPRGQHPVRGPGQGAQRGPIKPGSCPRVLIKCAMMNPPNACMRDAECRGSKKCCMGSCGMTCLNPR
ncbi:elafin [Molossus nigricans]|uniref:Peptidase inhibitor 3 n=1 Tax=Molossus molossus TaxID=27622 RepID=A0A7J8HK49_MOLMO|nr:elafin [Molossus molossus]KAF6472082.1 peptidase inhibitor 3 [Molossus molossus]